MMRPIFLHIENVKLNYTGTDSFIFINENSSIDTFTLANCDIKSNTLNFASIETPVLPIIPVSIYCVPVLSKYSHLYYL